MQTGDVLVLVETMTQPRGPVRREGIRELSIIGGNLDIWTSPTPWTTLRPQQFDYITDFRGLLAWSQRIGTVSDQYCSSAESNRRKQNPAASQGNRATREGACGQRSTDLRPPSRRAISEYQLAAAPGMPLTPSTPKASSPLHLCRSAEISSLWNRRYGRSPMRPLWAARLVRR